jgi:hypothetical protein
MFPHQAGEKKRRATWRSEERKEFVRWKAEGGRWKAEGGRWKVEGEVQHKKSLRKPESSCEMIVGRQNAALLLSVVRNEMNAPEQQLEPHSLTHSLTRVTPRSTLLVRSPEIMAAEGLSDYITLVSNDDFTFVVRRSAANISGAIKRMLDPASMYACIPHHQS